MFEVLLVAYIIVSVALIGFILIQQGKGAGMGASFGSGSSGTVFGSSGAGNFLTKTTSVLATIFFVLCLFLGSMSARQNGAEEEWTQLDSEVTEKAVNEEIPSSDKPTQDIPE